MTKHHMPPHAAVMPADGSLLSPDNFGNKPELALQLAQHLDNMTNLNGFHISDFGLDAPVAKQPVMALQLYLAAHGHPELKWDGLMGEKTRKATQEFLKANTGYDGPVDGSPLNRHALDSLSTALDNDKQMFAGHPPGLRVLTADEIKEFELKHPNAMNEYALKHPEAAKEFDLDHQQFITAPHALADALSRDDFQRHQPRSSLRAEQSLQTSAPATAPAELKPTENKVDNPQPKARRLSSNTSPSMIGPPFIGM